MHPSRIARLALAVLVAFVSVGACTLAGSMLLPAEASAAAPLPICSTAGEIAIQLSDGTGKCVENTCEAVLGAEGRAADCSSATAPSNVSVPDANSGLSGVAPVRAPVAAESDAAARAADDGTSIGVALAWIFAGIGIVALLAGIVIFARSRSRSRSRARDAARADAATQTPASV
jgi:hypothetical protein